MRQSQYKRLRQHFEEEDQSFRKEDSYPARPGSRGQQFPPRRETNNANRTKDRYDPRNKNDYLSILAPNLPQQEPQKLPNREDYNRNNAPIVANPYGSKNKEETKKKIFSQLDDELNEYKRKGEDKKKEQPQAAGRRAGSNNILDQINDNDGSSFNIEQDLSFVDLKQERGFKKEKKQDESFQIQSDKFKKEKTDLSQSWLNQDDREEEQAVIQKPQSAEKKKQPAEKKRQVNLHNSATRTLNRGFNNSEQEQSLDGSSCWVQQKLLQNLTLSQNLNDSSDIISNASQSYVSSINQQSQFHENPFPSESERSSLQLQNEKARIQSILAHIENSKDLEERDVVLEMVSVKNIAEIIVKEVSVIQLGMNIELTLKEEGIVVKNSEIDRSKLLEYISFYEINTRPKMYNADPISSAFRLCRMKVALSGQEESKKQSKFIKKQKKMANSEENTCKSLIKIIKLQLKCMNCEKSSEVPVIESSNEASLSCRKCDEQMIAKIHKISFEQ